MIFRRSLLGLINKALNSRHENLDAALDEVGECVRMRREIRKYAQSVASDSNYPAITRGIHGKYTDEVSLLSALNRIAQEWAVRITTLTNSEQASKATILHLQKEIARLEMREETRSQQVDQLQALVDERFRVEMQLHQRNAELMRMLEASKGIKALS